VAVVAVAEIVVSVVPGKTVVVAGVGIVAEVEIVAAVEAGIAVAVEPGIAAF